MLLALGLAAGTSADGYQQRIDRTDELLRAGRHAEALDLAEGLLHELAPRLTARGPEAEAALGNLYAAHALAACGVALDDPGDQAAFDPAMMQEAFWSWSLAQSLKPHLRTAPLDEYGQAGSWLERYRWQGTCEAPADLPTYSMEPLPEEAENLVPPRRLQAPAPVYSETARKARIEGRVVLRTVIDFTGRIHTPCVLDADFPVLVYLASEAVKEWRFVPAVLDGTPVSAHFQLAVNFVLREEPAASP